MIATPNRENIAIKRTHISLCMDTKAHMTAEIPLNMLPENHNKKISRETGFLHH